MPYYLFKLIPPRPTFIQDMSAEEGAIMQSHAAYWREHLDKGEAIAFGPVADPKGSYGVGIVKVENEDQVKELIQNDPAITAKAGFSAEYHFMPRALHR